MMTNPADYIRQYYRRGLYESGFSADKRTLGCKIWQRRDERIDTAIGCFATLHNILRTGYH